MRMMMTRTLFTWARTAPCTGSSVTGSSERTRTTSWSTMTRATRSGEAQGKTLLLWPLLSFDSFCSLLFISPCPEGQTHLSSTEYQPNETCAAIYNELYFYDCYSFTKPNELGKIPRHLTSLKTVNIIKLDFSRLCFDYDHFPRITEFIVGVYEFWQFH